MDRSPSSRRRMPPSRILPSAAARARMVVTGLALAAAGARARAVFALAAARARMVVTGLALTPGLVLAAGLALGAVPAAAHEIPADVVVRAFVKADDGRLRLLVRVPLTSMRDIELPLRGAGYLDLAATGALLPGAARLWIADYLRLYENGRPLGEERVVAARISLPSDPSFRSWDEALAHVRGPGLAHDEDLVPEQALLDVLLEVPVASPRSRFSLEPEWAHLGIRTTTVLRFLPADGPERVFQWSGDPGLVRLSPGWHHAAGTFLRLGFLHILGGLDHILFLLCMVIPLRRLGPLVAVVTAFTVAHSITLAASALGLAPDALWFPPLIEVLIALSIVWMAFENILSLATARGGLERRWGMAFGFGLVHGFGFSFLLRDSLQFAGAHLLTSLAAFNVGVELGQLLVLLVGLPVLALLFRRVPARAGAILLSALVAHSAWHWMVERGALLREYRIGWPVLDAALAAEIMRWGILVLVAVGVGWALAGVFGRYAPLAPAGDDDNVTI